MRLIDSHCHLPHNFEEAAQILKSAQEAGVEKVITIGTCIKENYEAIKLANNFENVFSTIGIYPHEEIDQDIELLRNHLNETSKISNKIVGIGECGIDITEWKGGRSIDDQIQLFEMQIEFAIKNNLPLIIHNRNGDEHVLKSLQKYRNDKLKGVAHCFASSWKTAKQFLDINFYISFSALITYPSRSDLLETVKNVPLDMFLVETDAPYLPPQGYRGQKNEPKYVKMVAQKVSEVKGLSLKEICLKSYENTCKVFALKIMA